MSKAYVPAAGDIARVNFNTQAGYEQAGHQLAVVLSPTAAFRRDCHKAFDLG